MGIGDDVSIALGLYTSSTADVVDSELEMKAASYCFKLGARARSRRFEDFGKEEHWTLREKTRYVVCIFHRPILLTTPPAPISIPRCAGQQEKKYINKYKCATCIDAGPRQGAPRQNGTTSAKVKEQALRSLIKTGPVTGHWQPERANNKKERRRQFFFNPRADT